MSTHTIEPTNAYAVSAEQSQPQARSKRTLTVRPRNGFAATQLPVDGTYRQAELFYLQKQIQAQTPMVIVLEDGEQLEGCIEWYDRSALKLRGHLKTLVYKSAIKYMYKVGEAGASGSRE